MKQPAAKGNRRAKCPTKEKEEENTNSPNHRKRVVAFERPVRANNPSVGLCRGSEREKVLFCNNFGGRNRRTDDRRDANGGVNRGEPATNVEPCDEPPPRQDTPQEDR